MSVFMAAMSIVGSVHFLKLESDTYALLPQDVNFLQNYNAYKDRFTYDRRTNIVVLDGPSPEATEAAQTALRDRLIEEGPVFNAVRAPGSDVFLRRNAAMYMSPDRLEDTVDRLSAAAPAIEILGGDPTLRGIADLLSIADTTAVGDGQIEPLLTLIGTAAQEAAADAPNTVSWASVFMDRPLFGARRIVTVQGRLDGAESDVGTDTSAIIRDAAAELGLTAENGFRVRLSGRGPLSQEEVSAAAQDIKLAGGVSLALLAVVLFAGFRSAWRIAACLVSLLVGLAWTFGFATVFVGQLTLLSIVFSVLFIGLGIDFFIHATLRQAEETGHAPDALPGEVFSRAAAGSASALTLCAVSTAIGFLSFAPTEFIGMAELGLIASAGMAMAWAASFTVLPACLALFGGGRFAKPPQFRFSAADRAVAAVSRNRRTVVIAAIVLGVAGAVLATQARFDFNSLALKDPGAESIQALLDLQADGTLTPYSAAIAFDTLEQAESARPALEALPQVAAVRSPADLVPADQDLKLMLVQDAAIFLWGAVNPGRPAPALTGDDRTAALNRILDQLRRLADARPALAAAATDAADALDALPPDRIADVEARLIRPLAHMLDRLRDFLSAEPFTLSDVPSSLSDRFFAPDGGVQIQVLPKDDLRDTAALGAFVDAVSELHPDATGRPVLEAGTGRIAVTAFLQAIAIASVAILILVLAVLRSIRHTLAVMVPLVLASLATVAFGVLAGVPFNLANIIAIPLIFGLGVDNGIHFVARTLETGDVGDVFRSSTLRAILLSAMTTMAAFSTLMLAGNPGIAGMGMLLTVAMASILVATLIVVPAILSKMPHT